LYGQPGERSRSNLVLLKIFERLLELLAEDAFLPRLRTRKLKGRLKGSWACSAGYDLRIVFKFVQYEGTEAILLETVGTHEEVY